MLTLYGGLVLSDSWVIDVSDEYRSGLVDGYRLPEWVFEALVDENIETLAFVDSGRGRYTSSVEDWQDYGVLDDEFRHLRQSRMSRA